MVCLEVLEYAKNPGQDNWPCSMKFSIWQFYSYLVKHIYSYSKYNVLTKFLLNNYQFQLYKSIHLPTIVVVKYTCIKKYVTRDQLKRLIQNVIAVRAWHKSGNVCQNLYFFLSLYSNINAKESGSFSFSKAVLLDIIQSNEVIILRSTKIIRGTKILVEIKRMQSRNKDQAGKTDTRNMK